MTEHQIDHLEDAMVFHKPKRFVWARLIGLEQTPTQFQANFNITEGGFTLEEDGTFNIYEVLRPYDVLETDVPHGKN